MYQIICDDFILHDVRMDNLQVINAKCDLEVNKTGSLTFSIPPNHPHYNDVNKHTSVIKLLRNDEILFVGRVLNDEIDFYNIKNVECEGELSYLLDSIQRHKEYHLEGGSENVIKTYLTDLINIHNQQVNDKRKQFTVGEVNVSDPNNYLYRVSSYENTLTVINDKLIDSYGGYILTRHGGDTTYIDYVSEYSGTCEQTIEFGKNIVDMTRYIKGEDIFTALIPLGASIEGEDNKRLTINGIENQTSGNIVKDSDYVYDSEAVKKWGWIWRVETWDDVTVDTNLLRKAKEFLSANVSETFSIELTAIDLNVLDVNIDSIKLGNKIHCISLPHNTNQLMFVKGMTIDIENPDNTKIQLSLPEGQQFKTTHSSFTETKKNVDKVINDFKNVVDESYATYGDVDNKLNDYKNEFNDSLSEYAKIVDVNNAFAQLQEKLEGI